jgi:hypothetical protein
LYEQITLGVILLLAVGADALDPRHVVASTVG